MKKKTYKYKNGATLLYSHSHSCNATAMRVGFLVGHKDNKIGGEAHFLEHLLLTRTKTYSKEELKDLRNKYGIYNAATGNRCTMLYIKKSNRCIEKSFELASEILFNPGFTQNEVDYEKNVIIEEYNLKKPSVINSYYYLFSKYCTSPFIPLEMEFGEPKILKTYSSRQLHRFMKKHYVASNFIISVTTSLTYSKIKKLVDKYFIPFLTEKENKSSNYNLTHTPINKLQYIKRSNQKNENVEAHIDIFFNKNYTELYEAYNLDFLLRHLNKHPVDSIFMRLRNAGLIYKGGVTAKPTKEQCSFEIYFTTSLEKFNYTIAEINKCILSNYEKGFKDEITNFKELKTEELDEIENIDTITEICSTRLARYNASYPELLPIKKRLKFLKNLTSESAFGLYKEIFNKDNPMFITIKSNKSRKDFPTFNQIKKELFKGLQ